MRTVKVRLNAADLSDQMIVMRGWLDRNRYEATRFDCDQDGDVLVLTSLWSGSDFARRCDGYSIHHTTAKVRTFPSSQCAFAATWVRLSIESAAGGDNAQRHDPA